MSFLSAQKVLADVDELTGDPQFRNNIRNLVNGLNDLVSLTEQLEQDTRFAQALTTGQGQSIERIRLTQVPTPNAPTTDGAPDAVSFAPPGSGPLLLTQDGRYYRFDAEKGLRPVTQYKASPISHHADGKKLGICRGRGDSIPVQSYATCIAPWPPCFPAPRLVNVAEFMALCTRSDRLCQYLILGASSQR